MDSYNHNNANKKRKFSKSNEQEEEELKRKTKKSFGCFGRCCTRKKLDITPIKKENIPKASAKKIPGENEKMILLEKISNVPMAQLTRSPLYNESRFCQKAFEIYDDPCIECTVQYGPDIWENILKNSSKELDDNNKSISLQQLDIFLDKKISDNDLRTNSVNEASTPFKNNVNSFINDVIGDGVDRISEIITTTSTDRNRQKHDRIDNKVSREKENRKLPDSEKRNENLDFIKQQHQYPGLVFEKQNLKKTSQMSHHSSGELSLDNASLPITANDYNWNLVSNETNIDQQNVLHKKGSTQDQAPYNWDYSEYQRPSSVDLSKKNHLIDTSINDQSHQTVVHDKDASLSDDDNTDLSYSIASVLPSNKKQKAQSHTNDSTNLNPSLNTFNQQKVVSTSELSESAEQVSDHPNKREHSQQSIYATKSNDLNHTISNQQQKSFSDFSEEKNILPTRNSTHSSQLNRAKISSDTDTNNKISATFTPNDESFSENTLNPNEQQPSVDDTKRPISSEFFQHQQILEQNDRFSSTSVSDLFKQISHAKKQKSLDLDSISTAYSIPVSMRRSVLTETEQMKSFINIDAKDQTKLANIDLPTNHIVSQPNDKQKKSSSNTRINNTFDQVHSKYDDIMNSWRHLLERLLSFMLPSTHNTDQNINLSSSTITSNTHSWSTLISSETLNMIQSDNIGPWWGRRDAYDRTPATFIFANEPLSAWYSIEMTTSNKQMSTSIENRSCYSNYYSCPNTCHCCCSSSSS